MKSGKIIILFILLILSSCHSALNNQLKDSNFPERFGYVFDNEHIFNRDYIDSLNEYLEQVDKAINLEISIITVKSIPENTEFDHFAITISDNWRVGKNNDGNGLIIVLSKSLKKVRISTTDKTQNYLTDEFCKKVIDENMIPEFGKGNYKNGILLGINEIIKKWK